MPKLYLTLKEGALYAVNNRIPVVMTADDYQALVEAVRLETDGFKLRQVKVFDFEKFKLLVEFAEKGSFPFLLVDVDSIMWHSKYKYMYKTTEKVQVGGEVSVPALSSSYAAKIGGKYLYEEIKAFISGEYLTPLPVGIDMRVRELIDQFEWETPVDRPRYLISTTKYPLLTNLIQRTKSTLLIGASSKSKISVVLRNYEQFVVVSGISTDQEVVVTFSVSYDKQTRPVDVRDMDMVDYVTLYHLLRRLSNGYDRKLLLSRLGLLELPSKGDEAFERLRMPIARIIDEALRLSKEVKAHASVAKEAGSKHLSVSPWIIRRAAETVDVFSTRGSILDLSSVDWDLLTTQYYEGVSDLLNKLNISKEREENYEAVQRWLRV